MSYYTRRSQTTVIQRMSYIYAAHVNLSTPAMEISRHFYANDLIWFRKHARASHVLTNADIFYRANINSASMSTICNLSTCARLPFSRYIKETGILDPLAPIYNFATTTFRYFTRERKRRCNYSRMARRLCMQIDIKATC